MKSQTLPWFVINIIGTMTFILILIAIITMQKNFYMTTRTLDDTTARMLFERELIVSPNCFEYVHTQYLFIDGKEPHYKFEYTQYPGVIDYNKLYNFYNFNCLRFDMSYAKRDTFAYKIEVYDLSNSDNPIFSSVSYVYNNAINCTNKYSDVIPVGLMKDGSIHPALLFLTICYMKGNPQDFCNMKVR